MTSLPYSYHRILLGSHSPHDFMVNNHFGLSQGVKAKKGCSIEYNINVADVFKVATACEHVRNFKPSSKGLYYYADFFKGFNCIVS